MDIGEFTELCEKEADRYLSEQQNTDIRFLYELTKNEFPDLTSNQATLIYRAYQTGVCSER